VNDGKADRPVHRDPWGELRRFTPARIALGRAGTAVPTGAHLGFRADHALARDAVHSPFDAAVLADELTAVTGTRVPTVASQAVDRAQYLRRPDLGRRLRPQDAAALRDGAPEPPPDVVVVAADGLSARAAHLQVPPVVAALVPLLADRCGLRTAVVVAAFARVALGDEIGQSCGAELVVVLLGERPGLSAADSLGAYVTWRPAVGRVDAERNCVSNIRPDGLVATDAAAQIAGLVVAARAAGRSGVGLLPAELPPALPFG
jgi:ethanolamine ammonia-lyase small subunit